MSSVASEAVLIGLDWGTTSLRAFLIGKDGDVLKAVSSSQGIMQVEGGGFASTFRSLVEPWLSEKSLPIIACGMITSRNGWVETPYLQVPSGSDDLAGALVSHKTPEGIDLHFVTCLSIEHGAAPDVMRGEETQIVGAAAMALGDGVYVMPGTHSKWVSARQRRGAWPL